MPDVFISYSRKDGAFAKRLNNALTALNRDVWIDWEDIPRGENWLNEIYSGIEAADTFLLIVSEHSLTSEICASEIAHARLHNKRIVPVIRQRIEGDVEKLIKGSWMGLPWEQAARDNWNAIKHINWVDMHDDAVFDSEFALLIQTLEDDLPHRKAHTRYLVRALEWDRGAHNPSYLLSGDEIATAEAWLLAADTQQKSPPVDAVHRRFIAESRRTADARAAQIAAMERRTRQFRRAAIALGIVGMLAVIATVIAGMSTLQISQQNATAQAEIVAARIEATLIQREVLQNQSELNASRAQQAVSRGELGDAVRLALQSAEQRGELKDTTAAHQALLDVLSVPAREIIATDVDEAITGFALAPDHRSVLVWTADRTAAVLSLPDLTTQAVAEFPDAVIEGVWNADGTMVALWMDFARFIWRPDGTSEPIQITASAGSLDKLAFSPDGEWLLLEADYRDLELIAVADWEESYAWFGGVIESYWLPDGRLMLINETGITISELSGPPDDQVPLSGFEDEIIPLNLGYQLSPDGMSLFYAESAELAWVLPLFGNAATVKLDIESQPSAMVWTLDSRQLILGFENGEILVWDSTGDTNRLAPPHDGAVIGVAVSREGSRILSWSEDGLARLWDAHDGVALAEFSHTASLDDARFSPDETQILTISRDNSIHIWHIDSAQALRITHGALATNHAASWIDDETLVSLADDGILRTWALGIETVESVVNVEAQNAVTLHPNHGLVMIWGADQPPVALDINTGEPRGTLWANDNLFGEGRFPEITLDKTGTYAMIVPQMDEKNEVWIAPFDLDFAPLKFRTDTPFTILHFDPYSSSAAGVTSDGQIYLYRADPALLPLQRESQIAAFGIAAAPDGQRVLVWDASVGHIVDMTNQSAPPIVIEHPGNLLDAYWSPDGQTIVTSGLSQAAIWDSSGELIGVLEPLFVRAVAFSPDSRYLALQPAGNTERRLMIFDIDARELTSTLSFANSVDLWTWLPDSLRLAVIGNDGTVSIVPAKGGQALTIEVGLGVSDLVLSSDNAYLYTYISEQPRVYRWLIDFEALIAMAEQRLESPDSP